MLSQIHLLPLRDRLSFAWLIIRRPGRVKMPIKLEGFNKYIGVQGIMALALTGAIIYMAIVQIPIPDVIIGLAGASSGYYFAKNGPGILDAARRR